MPPNDPTLALSEERIREIAADVLEATDVDRGVYSVVDAIRAALAEAAPIIEARVWREAANGCEREHALTQTRAPMTLARAFYARAMALERTHKGEKPGDGE